MMGDMEIPDELIDQLLGDYQGPEQLTGPDGLINQLRKRLIERAAGRRALGRSAIAIAAIQLIATAASVDNLGQMTFFLWLIWIVYASFALARGRHAHAARSMVPQST
jgi:hypothetical protein